MYIKILFQWWSEDMLEYSDFLTISETQCRHCWRWRVFWPIKPISEQPDGWPEVLLTRQDLRDGFQRSSVHSPKSDAKTYVICASPTLIVSFDIPVSYFWEFSSHRRYNNIPKQGFVSVPLSSSMFLVQGTFYHTASLVSLGLGEKMSYMYLICTMQMLHIWIKKAKTEWRKLLPMAEAQACQSLRKMTSFPLERDFPAAP